MAWNLHHPTGPTLTTGRWRAKCLVKLQDDLQTPLLPENRLVGCRLTGVRQCSRSAGEHTGNKRRVLGSLPQKGLEDSRGQQMGSLQRCFRSPGCMAYLAVHSVPGLWFLYLENHRAGLTVPKVLTMLKVRDPGSFESQLQRSTQNVLTSVHWNSLPFACMSLRKLTFEVNVSISSRPEKKFTAMSKLTEANRQTDRPRQPGREGWGLSGGWVRETEPPVRLHFLP